MADNKINTRIQLKNDIEEHWNQAENFIPRQGEVIIYNVDSTHSFPRIKVGDGSSYVNALPFITTPFESLPTGTSASTVAIGNHTHGLGNLTTVALSSKSNLDKHHATAIIRSSSSQLFFGGSGNDNKVDFIGLQLRGSNDEFQLVSETQLTADRNTLLFRQNDNASPTANNWNMWQQLVHTNYTNRVGGAGSTTTPVYVGTTGMAIPINYSIEANVPADAVFTDTNQYHKTGSWNGLTYTADAVNSADELAFTIPTGTSSTTVAVGNHNHNSTYLKLNGSNNMNDDVNIIVGEYDKFVNFWYDTNKKAGASWRLGMLGTGLEDANYFVIQSGTSTLSNTNWTNALRIGMNTHNIYIPSTTPSTSTSTGALTVGGGLGVAGQVTATTLKGTLATSDLSGQVAIANGGTGTATTTPNYVFAGPNSGSAVGAPSFRALVAADIPNLSWNKITSDKPTTLSGYGITDVKIDSGTITLGSNTITPVTSVNGHTGASVSVTAGDLGLSNALHFIGVTSTTLTDGSTISTLTEKSTGSLAKTTGFVDGDVVMDGDQLREYVWSGNAWRLLGITTSSVYTQPATAANNTWISQITQGTDGKITATTGTLVTTGTWEGTASKATTAADTSSTLYIVGVASGATSTLKHDTSVTVKGGAISATTYNVYSSGTQGTCLKSEENSTAWYTATLPAKTGTIAYISDVTESRVEIVRLTS